MKRILFCLTFFLIFSAGFANAQPPGNTFIKLGTVTPTVGVDSIQAGVIVSFPIIYGNRDTNSYNVSNAFIIFSDADGIPPTGVGPVRGDGTATWAHATENGGNFQGFFPGVNGIWLDTTEYFPASAFPGVYEFACFGCDGIGADTLSWSGAGGNKNGIPTKALRPKDSGVQIIIKILTKLSDNGKFICIDSSSKFPPTNTWKWPAWNYLPAYNTTPTWSGAHCYMVAIPPPPRISITPTHLSFEALYGGSLPVSQSFDINNIGAGTLDWSVSESAFWLNLTPLPLSGLSNHATITASVNTTTMLSPGTYSATVTVSSSNADNSPRTLIVDYLIKPDADGDGIEDAFDNCRTTPNANQSDVDFDGLGDACDPDFNVVQTPNKADIYYIREVDLDADNNADFVFTGQGSNSLYVSYGKNDHTLEPPRAYFEVGNAAITVDYLSGDNLLDIAARTATKLYILTNLGSREFSLTSIDVATSTSIGRPASGGLYAVSGFFDSNDVHRDVIVSPGYLLLGDGAGGFRSISTLGFTSGAIGASDFNLDGQDDIVAIMGDSAQIYYNSAAQFFPMTGGAVRIGFRPFDVANIISDVDINSDGKPDFVVATGQSIGPNDTTILSFVLGDGSGHILQSDTIQITGTAFNLATSDIDKDGDIDIVVVNSDSNTLQVFANDGQGNYQSLLTQPLGPTTSSVLALAIGDLNRDGSSDVLVGGQDSAGIQLAVNELPADPVLPDQMITVGYDNASLVITNPRQLEISRTKRTVAGSAYWRNDLDKNGFIDDQAYDYNLQYGEYRIVARPNLISPTGETFSVGIGIDGSQQAVLIKDGSWGEFLGRTGNHPFGSTDSVVLYYDVAPYYLKADSSPIKPPSGIPWYSRRPVFDWSKALAREPFALSYQFQLSRYYDFRTLIIDTSGLSRSSIQPLPILDQDLIYYWRFRSSDGAMYSPYSHPYAANIAKECCRGLTGNVDCDPGDGVDISDLTALIDYLYITFAPLCCPAEANDDGQQCLPGQGCVDISDLTALIDYLYISFLPLAPCQ